MDVDSDLHKSRKKHECVFRVHTIHTLTKYYNNGSILEEGVKPKTKNEATPVFFPLEKSSSIGIFLATDKEMLRVPPHLRLGADVPMPSNSPKSFGNTFKTV
jgi:hypothetical protein